MIEKTIYDYLTEEASVPVYMAKPADDVPEEYILIHKAGGGEENRIYSSLFLIKCISTVSLFRAASICEEIVGLMDGANGLADVVRCRLNSEYNNTDVASKHFRYDATFNLIHY